MMHNTTPRWVLRRSTSLLTISLMAMFGLVAAPALSVTPDECVPSNGTPAVFSGWASGGSTPWQHDQTPPADPDGRGGEDNPLNLAMIGSPPETQKHVTQEFEPPTPATDDEWIDRVWHNYTGNQPPPNEPPALNDPKWHALPADPQSENHAFEAHTPNVPYNVSNENNGRGAWFLWTATLVPGTPGDPGQAEGSHTDYRWPILTRTFTPGQTPVECPSEGPDVEGDGDETPSPKGDMDPSPVQVAGEQAAVTPTAPAQVPTHVASGLGETASAQSDLSPLGLLMVMFGVLLMAAAAVRRRARV